MPRKPKPTNPWLPDQLPVRKLKLKKAQWEHLKQLGHLSPKARPYLEKEMGRYSWLKKTFSNQPPAAQTREGLGRMAETAHSLLKQLTESGNDTKGTLAQQVPTEQGLQLRIAYAYIHRFTEDLRRFHSCCKEAQAAVQPSKTGPSSEDVDTLMGYLHNILKQYSSQHTKGLSRSNNKGSPMEFVRAVFDIVDPDVNNGALDLSVKKTISESKNCAEK